MDITQKVTAKKKKARFFDTYISKVLKQNSESSGITANAKQQLNSALCIISKLISIQVINLTEIAKKKTVSEKEVMNALRIILPVQLAVNAIAQGQKAIDTFDSDEKIKGASRQDRAGIIFPPSILEKFLRNFGYSKVMVSSHAPVYMAGALEYLTSEILDNAILSTKDNKRVRITIRDLEIGIRNDEEFDTLFTKNNISFLGGGVIPFIHSSLLSKSNRKKRIDKNSFSKEKKKHRFRPGTVSLREIRRFQKLSNCLTFAKSPFEKIVRDIVDKHHLGDISMKVSKSVFISLQYFVEQQIVSILRDANFAAIHAGRVKLMPIDIEFVRAISTGKNNPYHIKLNTNETLEVNDLDEVEDEDEVEVEDEDEDEVEDE
jgi:histone H3/H4